MALEFGSVGGNMTLKLWKFDADCGRVGSLSGLIAVSQADIDNIIGEDVYFGEVLGKHSDITVRIGLEDFTLIDIPEEYARKIMTAAGGSHCISGYSPFDYWERVDDDEYWAEQNEKSGEDFD